MRILKEAAIETQVSKNDRNAKIRTGSKLCSYSILTYLGSCHITDYSSLTFHKPRSVLPAFINLSLRECLMPRLCILHTEIQKVRKAVERIS